MTNLKAQLPEPRLLREYLKSTGEMLQSRGEKPEMEITFSRALNRQIWGLQRRKLYVVAARTSQGKSALCGQILMSLLNQNKRILFCSLEMDVESIVERLFCVACGIDNVDLLKGEMKRSVVIQQKYEDFARVCSTKHVLVTQLGKSVDEMRQIIKNAGRVDAVIVDHLHHIRTGSDRARDVINNFISEFREEAIRGNFVAMIAAQLNRMSQDEEKDGPDLTNLKESSFIEEVADVVLLLYWPFRSGHFTKKPDFMSEEEFQKLFIIKVEKNRGSFCGRVYLQYEGKHFRFSDWPVELNDEHFRKTRKGQGHQWTP